MRPKVKKYVKPNKITDYPTVPAIRSGNLVSINAGWRTFKPVINMDQCVGCLQCYLLCPDGVISRTDNNKVKIDFEFCKGCGVCAKTCKLDAIAMIKEDANE